MINRGELEICRRRGHVTPGIHQSCGWIQCGMCGMWVRQRIVTDEREDDPPEDEIDGLMMAKRFLKRAERKPGQPEP